jgi:CheY-like chemotaxis protein
VVLFKEAVGLCAPRCQVEEAEDGEVLLETLADLDRSRRLKEILFILLDMRMPRRDGIEVLYEIKGNPRYRSIPVIIWSGEETEKYMPRAYALGCNTFVEKPVGYEALLRKVRDLTHYWLGLAKLPAQA